MDNLLRWNIYDIKATTSSLNGVMLRGKIRKLGIEKKLNVIVENTEDRQNGVRFAVLAQADADIIKNYLSTVANDITVELIDEGVLNPVLSKMKVNIESRYEL